MNSETGHLTDGRFGHFSFLFVPRAGKRSYFEVMTPPLRFGIVHDFRCPPASDITMPQVYAETFEQIELAESLGMQLCWFTEHHFIEDGYLPNFVPVAAAAAAKTARIRFSTDICLLPFRHPVRLAEDLAILDNISNGRMELGVGMGYATHEFQGFDIPISRRDGQRPPSIIGRVGEAPVVEGRGGSQIHVVGIPRLFIQQSGGGVGLGLVGRVVVRRREVRRISSSQSASWHLRPVSRVAQRVSQ